MITKNEFEFTTDWFATANTTVWTQVVEQLRPKRILEVGSFEGRSICWLIEHCAAQNPLEVYCIDTWEGSVEHSELKMGDVELRFDSNISLAIQKAKNPVSFVKCKSTSVVALAELIAKRVDPFDLIYVDGGHYATNVLEDAVLSYQLLRKGGILIFDDYLWEPHWVEPELRLAHHMPKTAIDALYAVYQRKLRWLDTPSMRQVFMQKQVA